MGSDVLIIGGGVIGLAIARELSARGERSVTVVDRGLFGGEASWAAAGMLAPNIEAGGSDIFHRFCTESLDLYPDLSEGLLAETAIDIELNRTGTICVGFNGAETDKLKKHLARGAAIMSGDEIRTLEPWLADEIAGGVFFPNDWQVDNRGLVAALGKSVESSGIRMLEQTPVIELLIDGDRVTGAVTAAGRLEAEVTVLATGAWTSLIKTGGFEMPFSVRPIRGQMASFDTGERRLGHVVFSASGYLVPRADGRLLIGATVEDVGFENVTTDDAIESLRQAAVEMMPKLAGVAVADRWSGLRPFANDGLPVLGAIPGISNLIVATGHYRNGILLAPRTAQIVADKIVAGADSEFFDSFGAERFGLPNATATANF
ncbi:MAG TPA: glycine oxidase ThiO [Pyrinomonadaceae bacterium]|nr:glycine oxidase ThiO [Pyrinomonadaceae bacterium]